MEIAILGPLEIRDGTGRPIEIAGTRVRTLLVRLAVDAGRPVSVAALIDAVWGERPPADESNALQTLVSRLRRALGDPGAIVQSGAGYRLAGEPDDVDAHRFERLAAEGSAALRTGETRRASGVLAEALAMWRGPAPEEEIGAGYATRLVDLRLAAQLDRIEADLADGVPGLVAELEPLAAEHPLHERLTGQLMRALAANGQPAAALQAYERLRARLADELGADPAPEVQALHVALLRGAASATPRRTNLKAQLTSFVGRDEEVARIGKLLQENRLVTLVGPGGAGKTRLASEAAAKVDATDGIWLAELAPLTDGGDVPQAVLGALGLREVQLLDRAAQQRSARDTTGRVLEVLADKQVVLLLDNCEHVLDASARLAGHLLEQCPGLRVLTTSREPLGIIGETLLPVPPLGQPDPHTPAEYALDYPAVRLFADRAHAVRPDFHIDDETVADVIEIVRRLDGLPLAIELAAARLRTMPLPDIAGRLSDRFRLLTGGSRTALPRHRTLRAVVEWSWDLLTPAERLLAERLAMFTAGVTVASATAVCADDEVTAPDVPDLLASLVDKSLLQPVGGGRRMRMLETIREYGVERLAERGELAAARGRHADHFAALVHEAQQHLTCRDQLPWLDRLAAERDNVLAALRYRCDTGEADAALRIAIELASYAMIVGSHAEVASWMADALNVPGGTDDDQRRVARALHAMSAVEAGGAAPPIAGEPERDIATLARELAQVSVDAHPMVGLLRAALAYFAGDRDLMADLMDEGLRSPSEWTRAAVQMFRAAIAENDGDIATMRVDAEEALAKFRLIGDRWGTANALRALAQLRSLDGQLPEAIAAYGEALTLMREMRSREDEAFLLLRLCDLRLRLGDDAEAHRLAQEARLSAAETGSYAMTVLTIVIQAEIERQASRLAEARELHEEGLRLVAALPSRHPVQSHAKAMVYASAARRAYADGDAAAAAQYCRDAYTAGVDTRDLPLLAGVGVAFADIACGLGEFARAAELLGAADRLRGSPDATALDIRRITAAARDALGAAVFTAAYERGHGLDRDGAIQALAPS